MKYFRALIIVIISFLIWAAIFELLTNWWIKKWGDPLDKVKQILIVDRQLGWRQRPNFRGRFLNIALRTNELGLRNKGLSEIKKNAKNILILGPSSTFGWGVEEKQTYPAILQNLLHKRYPDIDINVINAGQIGFSSWQGLKFYKHSGLKELKPDVLIIAYGANDVDRFRFFYNSSLSDKEEFAIARNAWNISLQNALMKFNFIALLSRKVSNLLDNFMPRQTNIPVRRVADVDFERNIKELISIGETNGSEIILLTSPYQLPLFDKVNPEIEKLSREYFNEGKNKYGREQYPEALSCFEKSIAIRPDQNKIYYYLSSCYSHLGNYSKKKEMLERARKTEPKRIANDIGQINSLLREIAREENVSLLDTERYLALSEDNTSMFLDPIHMSVDGHRKIAENLTTLIYEKSLLKVNKKTSE